MSIRPETPELRAADCEAKARLRVLIVGAALRNDSFNVRLANLAAQAVGANRASIDHRPMSTFVCEPYNQDVELSSGIPAGAQALGGAGGGVGESLANARATLIASNTTPPSPKRVLAAAPCRPCC